MTNILRIFGMLQLLGTVAVFSAPANAMQLQVSGGSPYMCAVVQGGNTAPGTPVIAYPCSGGPEVQWNWVSGQLQGIGTANGTSMCLDVKGASTAPGTLVDLWPCNGGANQQWITYKVLNGGTALKPWIVSGLSSYGGPYYCLDSSGGPSVGGGTQLVLNICNGASSQYWTAHSMQFESVGSAPYLCANVQGSKTASGTPVLAYSCNDAPNELWTYVNSEIQGVGTENGATKCLTASGETAGSLVTLSNCGSPSNSNTWIIGNLNRNSPTSILLLEAALCLDRSGGPSVGGATQLVVNTCTNATSQNWNVR